MGTQRYLIYKAVTQQYWLIPILLELIVFQSKAKKSDRFIKFLKSMEIIKATKTSPKENRIFIKQRKGFKLICTQIWLNNIYCICFWGKYFIQYNQLIFAFETLVEQFKLVGIVFLSRFQLNFVNIFIIYYQQKKNREIIQYVAKKPSHEDVEKYHQVYLLSVKDLCDQCKGHFIVNILNFQFIQINQQRVKQIYVQFYLKLIYIINQKLFKLDFYE
ncbi:unnamed protein product [Paramecium sonneborni]|uniref:Transmembrane protein n=1 Tax=Paramecium sonneborni TaxID=65129 RepID=A0A8S1R5M6_9CILI|nr:unnamed protein product [Paramecium sonneborni]